MLASNKVIIEMGQELNREIVEELKDCEKTLSQSEYEQIKRELNKERIKALGMFLIRGGKYEAE